MYAERQLLRTDLFGLTDHLHSNTTDRLRPQRPKTAPTKRRRGRRQRKVHKKTKTRPQTAHAAAWSPAVDSPASRLARQNMLRRAQSLGKGHSQSMDISTGSKVANVLGSATCLSNCQQKQILNSIHSRWKGELRFGGALQRQPSQPLYMEIAERSNSSSGEKKKHRSIKFRGNNRSQEWKKHSPATVSDLVLLSKGKIDANLAKQKWKIFAVSEKKYATSRQVATKKRDDRVDANRTAERCKKVRIFTKKYRAHAERVGKSRKVSASAKQAVKFLEPRKGVCVGDISRGQEEAAEVIIHIPKAIARRVDDACRERSSRENWRYAKTAAD